MEETTPSTLNSTSGVALQSNIDLALEQQAKHNTILRSQLHLTYEYGRKGEKKRDWGVVTHPSRFWVKNDGNWIDLARKKQFLTPKILASKNNSIFLRPEEKDPIFASHIFLCARIFDTKCRELCGTLQEIKISPEERKIIAWNHGKWEFRWVFPKR